MHSAVTTATCEELDAAQTHFRPSKRKRSNAKTQPVPQQIDLSQHNLDELPPEGSGNSEAMGSQFNISAPSVPLQSSGQYSVPSAPLQSSSQYNIPSVPLQSSSQYTPYHISTANYFPIQDGAFEVEATPNHISTQQIGTSTHPYAPQSAPLSILHAPPTANGSLFTLKWLLGTRVSRCYGCGGVIQNPPLNCPDDLIVVYRDIRQFRHRITGQLTTSTEPQNVHFHLRMACVRARYPHFVSSSLHVPPDIATRFNVEHLSRLLLEFGWTPGN